MNWEQFRAILWLRWRLSRNQLTRGNRIGAVLAGIATVLLVIMGLGATIGATLVGTFALNHVSEFWLMVIWDVAVLAMLGLSVMGVMTELQRSESVDLTRLLHLPISLKQVFVFNYLASLVSVGTILALTSMLGLVLGLVIGRGAVFLLAVPLVLGFVFMVTAWIYCLRGWLLSLMVNPRRRRSIIMWVTLAFVLIGQTPQLVNLMYQRKARAQREARQAARQAAKKDGTPMPANDVGNPPLDEHGRQLLTQAHNWVPLLWLPNGMRNLATANVWPTVWGSAGLFLFGWWGISRAYNSTIKFYRAEEKDKPGPLQVPGATTAPAAAKADSNWVARQLPWLPEDTAGVMLAQLRSLSRAPEVRMMLGMGLFMAIFLPVLIFFRTNASGNLPVSARPLMATGVMMMVLFSLLQLVCNQFGADRDAFRGFVLLPTPRARILLGKNLAYLPVAALVAFIPLVAVSVFARLPVVVILATMLQFTGGFLMYCTIGNLSSILVPFRIASGSLKPTKQSWQTSLGIMAVHLSFPLVISPIFIPAAAGWLAEEFGELSAGLVNLLASFMLAAVMAAIYGFTLRPLGRLFRSRETKILRAVTEVTE